MLHHDSDSGQGFSPHTSIWPDSGAQISEWVKSRRIRAAIVRGGTSKGVFLFEEDLPRDPAARDAVILKVFGSPDPRQVNGLGGADPLTSKVAIIGRSTAPDADVDYTVGYVGIAQAARRLPGQLRKHFTGRRPISQWMRAWFSR